MDIRKAIVSILSALLIFGAGVALGYLFNSQSGGDLNSPEVMQTNLPVVKALSSKVIPSVAAYGTITKIEGNNITVTSDTDSIVVPIRTDANIYSFSVDVAGQGAPTSKKITLGDLKNGDKVSINLRVLSSGKLEGYSVIVPPVEAAPAATN